MSTNATASEPGVDALGKAAKCDQLPRPIVRAAHTKSVTKAILSAVKNVCARAPHVTLAMCKRLRSRIKMAAPMRTGSPGSTTFA